MNILSNINVYPGIPIYVVRACFVLILPYNDKKIKCKMQEKYIKN